MKFLFDMFPIILFFVAYKMADIYIATGVAIAATIVQITWVWFKYRKVEKMQWVSLAIIAVFGGATLFFHNEAFIKWKPTVLYWLFSLILLISALAFKKNLIRSMMDAQVQLPEPIWNKLNLAWAGFFAVMGILNLWVAMNFSTNTWVNFKMFGSLGLMLVFVIAQGIVLGKYMTPETEANSEGPAASCCDGTEHAHDSSHK